GSPPATGDNANSPDTGAYNGDRVRQATRLLAFADEFARARGTEAVFLVGDFNSYTQEDPMHVLYGGGYDAVERPGDDESYSFSGLSGSLDHILGNAAAMELVTGSDVWDINASESAAFQYSRYNYNVTQFFDATNPFAASDHNPEVVGLDVVDDEVDPAPSSVRAEDVRMTYGKPATVTVEVTSGATGTVQVLERSRVVATGTLAAGVAKVVLPARSLKLGRRTLTLRYLGDAAYQPSQGTVTVTVVKAAASL
ncbi:Ig-like domain repeat protein, partial [uncultured Nocardioides sp.]|uniref:Ig-like domain repeat protein n=1 Tax=uncultured Nocardioides sp. TaxID=198441 RepID=UPI0025FD25B9